ncbi:hypothetical protein J2X46_000127 [Nocardioides sp. BE266]|uniref:hypothetical protein n=1 Tax=Nocardioides sp. BE266 TaxID=2817725 RepID=UPI002859E931|nr:hypothetical protein [Nocardioides sp. BE266]MDR7251155.1 hypothetical protein [Nocardioides sp. BE266]
MPTDSEGQPPLTELISPSRAVWAGRVSQHRREQIAARMAHPTHEGPTGPVQSERLALDLAQVRIAWATQVQERWLPVVKMLCRELDNVSSVVLCSSAGGAVATYGLASADVARASNLTGVLFGAAAALNESGLESVHLTAGITHTVVAPVHGTEMGQHVLAVTADGATIATPLITQTRRAAEELRGLLAGQP